MLHFVSGAACIGCAPEPKSPLAGPVTPLALDDLSDLVSPSGLTWLLDLAPRQIVAHEGLARALREVVPTRRWEAFRASNGGVDPSVAEQLTVAVYAHTELYLLRLPVDPIMVLRAFETQAESVDGRSDAASSQAGPRMEGITRIWGTVRGQREQVALFGTRAVGLERGQFGPLLVAERFAQKRLRRALPALRHQAMALLAKELPPSPARFFAPGPFEPVWGKGLGGILTVATAIGASLVPSHKPGFATLHARVQGAWKEPAAARARLLSWHSRFVADPLPRLCGLHKAAAPEVIVDGDTLVVTWPLDLFALARGLRDATSTEIRDIMKRE